MELVEIKEWLTKNNKNLLIDKPVYYYKTMSNLMKQIKKSMLKYSKKFNIDKRYDFRYLVNDLIINFNCDIDDIKLIPYYIDDENKLCCDIYANNKPVDFYRISLDELI